MNSKLREKLKIWIGYYRENPHRFAEDYFGVKLKTFQKILVYLCFKYPFFTFLASRGLGKSWLIALIAIIKCILYPGSRVVIASGTKGQAEKIIDNKIKQDFWENYPNIRKEIADITTSQRKTSVTFHNGSIILAVTANDNARGERANLIIVDEHRLIKKEVYEKVIEPFATYLRQPGYLNKPEYTSIKDVPNQIIYMSSAWYKNHWIFNDANDCVNAMVEGKNTRFITAIPYHLGIKEHIINPLVIKNTMSKSDFDPISFGMEYKCQFFGEASGALLKLSDFDKNRKLTHAYIPRPDFAIAEDITKYGKPRPKHFPKQEDELRLISIDVSLMPGKENDNTILSFLRLLPAKNGAYYIKQLVNTIALNGLHSDIQAKYIKRWFYDFSADYIVMDTNGNGLSVFDSLAKVSYDEETGQEYPAFSSFNKEEYDDRVLDDDPDNVIFAINPNVDVNHNAAMRLKGNLERGRLNLLVDVNVALSNLYKGKDSKILTVDEEAELLQPFVSTTMMINEAISLEIKLVKERFIALVESGTARKDRYSSLAYGIYFASILEEELEEEDGNYNVEIFTSSI